MTAYQPLSTDRTDVVRAKRIYGIWFGTMLGLIFAAFAWGLDAYQLSHINTLYPWLKFICGAVLCTIIGGIAGWLSARFDKPMIAFPIWIVAAMLFAWLTVALPLLVIPRLLSILEPGIEELLHYSQYAGFASRVGVAFGWIVILVSINGLLQLPLSEGAVFSTSLFGKLTPILVSLVLMGIAGTIIDGLTNEVLRSPIDSLNSSIQYYLDNLGKEVDRAEARKMHQGALRAVKEAITPERVMTVSGYDQYLGEIDILVKFKNAWVECLVFYNQPSNCKQVGTIP